MGVTHLSEGMFMTLFEAFGEIRSGRWMSPFGKTNAEGKKKTGRKI